MDLAAYEDAVFRQFDRAYASGNRAQKTFTAGAERIIIFSDHHRGERNSADDFGKCEHVYNHALDHYFSNGHTLVLLGDVEDLWESWPNRVARCYEDTLKNEARFCRADRYVRIRGNHDDAWQDPALVSRYLQSGDPARPIRPYESLLLEITDGQNARHKFFLMHGHQGSLTSDFLRPVSEPVVRYGWRNVQRMFKVSFDTPAKNAELRTAHDAAMLRWALRKGREGDKLVLIAGHTHKPVFSTSDYIASLQAELASRKTESENEPETSGRKHELERLVKETVQALREALVKVQGGLPNEGIPCYFNTGCCCYKDDRVNTITGIEMTDGTLALVKWSEANRTVTKSVMASCRLSDIFRKL